MTEELSDGAVALKRVTELEGRVHHLENEDLAIYDTIKEETRAIRSVQTEHGDKLAEILRRLPAPPTS